MEITEIRIKLMESSEDRLRAFCSITIDGCFVVRDLKIIDGTNGPFVAMPSRKLSGQCHRCNHKNHLRASYCNHCGAKLQSESNAGYDSPQKLYADVAHPINSECRELIQNAVIEEFESELRRASQPGYRSRYDDDFDYPDTDVVGEDDVLIDKPTPKTESESGKSQGNAPRPKFKDSRPKQTPADGSSSEPSDNDDFGAGIF